MQRRTLLSLAAATPLGALLARPRAAAARPADTTERFAEPSRLPFRENRPTPETARALRDELLFQRATQAYLWALPLVNTLGMKAGSEKTFGAGFHVMPVWKKRLDAKTLITTPNSDVIYAMSYVDLGKDGPLVFEAPPRLQGILLDFWQRPIPVDGGTFQGDVGFFGPDQGQGGKFLLLPPGYKGEVPEGYFVYRSGTNNVFIFLRAFYPDPTNLRPAVELIEQSKVYPLGAKARPMQFPDASGVPVDMLPLRDGAAFDRLKQLVDSEGPHLDDPDARGLLAAIGIVKGQPFAPDAHTLEILDLAARTGYRMSRVIGFEETVSGRSFQVYPDRHWLNPMADATPERPSGPLDLAWHRTEGGQLDLDTRIWFFTNYYSISPGMLSQVPGKGAGYVIAFRDADGVPLTGNPHYRLNLPRDVPAANFWSVTIYEAENASGLANGQPFPSLGSRDEPAKNADGSIDLYFSPKPPAGKESNWLATVPGRGFFAVIRLYGPTKPFLDRSWKPGDFVKLKPSVP